MKTGTWLRSLQGRSSIALMITAAILIQINGAVQYFFSRDGISKEVQQRARKELKVKNLEIEQTVTSVETAVANMVWAFERELSRPDSLYALERRVVEQNSMVTGCGIGFVADYYPENGRWFEPYVERLDNGSLEARQIGSESHDYLNAQWFLEGLKAQGGYWSEPYFDDAGARDMICSYTFPLHDIQGRTAAVMCVDISLNWLIDMFASPEGSSQASVLVSRQGRILACPDKTLVMQTTVNDISDMYEDSMVKKVNFAMLSGDSGYAKITGDDGQKSHVFYAPVEGNTHWSMAVVFADKDIYHGLHAIASTLTLLMLLGLGLMAFIIYRAVRGFKRLQAVNAEKERIGSELKIASGIQMGMLPKTFPPYPDRDEVSIYGILVPAKEVGGDLYDFYIRDEKLFFCLGDVSGKGVPASLVMAVTRSLFRTVSAHIDSPEMAMTQMNNAMSEMNESSLFVTLFIGILDLRTGLLHFSNAGHCPPVILGNGASALTVDANIPLGVMPNWNFTAQQTTITPGQTIFLYTDGLTEAENANHAQFGEEHMMEFLSSASSQPHQLIDAVSDAVHAFVDGAEQSDDLTMLAIEFSKYLVDKPSTYDITLHNDVQEIPRLAAFIEEVAEANGINMSLSMNINLAMEEAVVNVMNYAYPTGTQGDIDIQASLAGNELTFTITDSGTPFDPTQTTVPDTSLEAEDRPIGGLGIHLVRQLMDTLEYQYLNGKNILTLKKKI